MKRLSAGLIVLLVCCLAETLQAARYWISPVASNWNNTANWAASSGGTGGVSVPGTSDDVTFDNNGSGSCTIDITVSVRSITVAATYTGTIIQGSNGITTSIAGTFAGGTFNGGSGNITIGGAFTINGTNFTSTSGILDLNNSAVAFISNSFVHNNGTVKLNSMGNQTLSGISPVFYILEFVGRGNTIAISSVGSITVLSSLNTSGTLFYNITTGIIDVKGNINSANTATGCGGDATINLNGPGAQNFTGSTVLGAGALPQLTINTTGSVTFANFPAVSNNFTYTAGTLNAGTSTFCFAHGNFSAYTITGNFGFNNVAFPVNTSLLTVAITGTITAAGDLTVAGSGSLLINTGSINVNGNINLTNTGSAGGGSATINIVGSGNQNLDGTAITLNQCRLPLINVNKAGGTLFLLGNISASANLTYTAGSVNPGISTCYLVNNLTLTGNLNFYNFTISASTNATVTIAAGTTISVSNTFDLENNANYIVINGGTVAVQGDIINNNTSLSGGGTGTVLINGSGTQNISSTGVLDQGRFPGVTIDKPSGTLTLPGLITVKSDWTYTAGTIDVTTNNSTVVFENTMSISGTHTLKNIVFNGVSNYTFNIAPSTTLTASGNLGMTGSGAITLNTGTINLNGNLSLANTAGGGGTTVLTFVGGSNQAITNSVAINQNCLPSVTIDKSGGTLTFPPLITVRGNWVYTAGTLDVLTNNSTVVFADPVGTGVFSITGSHTLNNVAFEASNNNTLTVATGTILTVSGTYSTVGTANMYINTPVAGTTAIQAQGNLSIGNSGTLGGGSGTILINGAGAQLFSSSVAASHGLVPNITIQKASGTLSMSGIISESRNWTYTSGTVDAVTNLSTVVFGNTNLLIASAGMSFFHVVFTSNTSTLTNNLTVLGNVTINGSAVLFPGTNTLNVAGNWTDRSTAGFTESTSTVNFNGSALQTITSPGGENFANATVNNSGAGIQLMNNATAGNQLTMTLGNIDLNNNNFILGLSAVNNGTLSRISGTIINSGNFIRWYKAGLVADGSAAGLFPMGTSADYRPMYISAPSSAPTAGGTISVGYTDAPSNTAVSTPDPPFTVMLRKDLNWAVLTTGITGGSYNMQIQGTGYGSIGAVSDLRLTLVNSVAGTAGTNGGTVANPQVNRTALSLTNLSNTFYLGSINSTSTPLPVTLVYFTALLTNNKVDLKWATAVETSNNYFTILRSGDGKKWDSLRTVPGRDNFGTNSFYQEYDLTPLPGRSFYRLKHTDFNGQSYFSAVQEIDQNSLSGQLIIYPNPASSFITVSYSGQPPYKLRLFNSGGQLLEKSSGKTGSTTMEVSGFPVGIYFLQIEYPGNSITKIFSIVR